MRRLLVILSVGLPGAALGGDGGAWGTPLPELVQVLALTGDASRGQEAFVVCRGCHKPDGAGVVSGAYPRLTGQHARVIMKQVTDVRAGVRQNPKMKPFAADHAVSTQEIADLAVFLSQAATTREGGKGPGTDLARGQALYASKGCVGCHGARGEGNGERFFPALAGQHFGYLERELQFIQQGTRGNSHPEMVQAVKGLEPKELAAIADYLSRLSDHRKAAAAKK